MRRRLLEIGQRAADACLAAQTERYAEYTVVVQPFVNEGECRSVAFDPIRIALIASDRGVELFRFQGGGGMGELTVASATGYHFDTFGGLGRPPVGCARPSACDEGPTARYAWEIELAGDAMHGRLEIVDEQRPGCRLHAQFSGSPPR